MAVSYTDDEIEALVGERKRLPLDWEHRTRLKAKRGHHEQYLELTGDAGTCLFKEANFSVPPKAQGELFDAVGGPR